MECYKCISMKKAGRRSSMKSHFHGLRGLGVQDVRWTSVLHGPECNGDAWRDEYGAIFIIFTIKEMMRLLHLGNKKINKMLKELEVHNLIYRSHQGLGKPKKISAVFRLYESYCKK